MSQLIVRKFTRKKSNEEVLQAYIGEPTMQLLKGCGEEATVETVDLTKRKNTNAYPVVDRTGHYNPQRCSKVAGWVDSPQGRRLIRFRDMKDITPPPPNKKSK